MKKPGITYYQAVSDEIPARIEILNDEFAGIRVWENGQIDFLRGKGKVVPNITKKQGRR